MERVDNYYNGKFLVFVFAFVLGEEVVYYYHNCQGRSKDVYKPEVLKVTFYKSKSSGDVLVLEDNDFH